MRVRIGHAARGHIRTRRRVQQPPHARARGPRASRLGALSSVAVSTAAATAITSSESESERACSCSYSVRRALERATDSAQTPTPLRQIDTAARAAPTTQHGAPAQRSRPLAAAPQPRHDASAKVARSTARACSERAAPPMAPPFARPCEWVISARAMRTCSLSRWTGLCAAAVRAPANVLLHPQRHRQQRQARRVRQQPQAQQCM